MTTPPNFHEIERLAYFLYDSRGRQQGQALTHRLEAETQLSEYSSYCAQDSEAAVENNAVSMTVTHD